MLRIIDLALGGPVRFIGNIAEALGVSGELVANNFDDLVAQDVAEEVERTCPKRITFAGVLAALQMG